MANGFQLIHHLRYVKHQLITFPESNIAPENGWLGDDPFLLGRLGLFSGAILVSEVVHRISESSTLN